MMHKEISFENKLFHCFKSKLYRTALFDSPK